MNNYTIWGFLGPATWPAWLTLIGTAGLLVRGKARRWPLRSLVAAVALWVAFAVLPTGNWLLEPLERRFPRPVIAGAAIDHIVVLAGAENLGASALTGRPELTRAAERVVEGAALARELPDARLWIVGGVRGRWQRSDADWTALSWQRLGIPAAQVGKIDGTLDTCANADGFAARHAAGTVLLVTSARHMPRAVACFRAAGVSVTPYPVDYLAEAGPRPLSQALDLANNIERVDDALHEWIGLIYYRLRGRTRELLPAPEPEAIAS